ncbi:PAS domain-containing sensor histidine kinase [Mesorhizobium sp. WSM4313]|uniref:hybrid sensor histidine kinase/response regulator n=1 Tax=Mesorhizobium sp. WSM4313 TaxID=2029412 RepID=UPI000BB04CF3|nr:PAS domain-containing sensor histidine kinase [Mesorhizobium sp. WSM4313]PBB19207.1 hybrid sensor histidine kinase/response regulator [Mesorhizobium sp. WSM4313]
MPPTTADAQHLSDSRRLELFIDAVADYAIYTLDADGLITSWNAGAEKIKGYAASEVLGQHFSRFFTVEDQANGVPSRMLAAAKAEGRYEAEGWRVRKDGTRFWSSGLVQRVLDRNGVLLGYAKITRDITERVAAHESLLQSERRFRILVDGVTDYAIYMLDPSGVVTNWNAGAERLKGYAAEEIVGQHFSKFYTREERAKGTPLRVLEAAVQNGRYEGEGWRVRKDGSRFWASVVVTPIHNDAGRLEGFAKVTRDITERRAAHEALRQSERQFRLLVSGVTDYALFMLDPNGLVTSWNAGAERIKGYAAEEIIGQHFSRFYTEHDRAAGLPGRALHTATRDGRFETEGHRVRRDGTLFWANVVIDPIRDERGELIGFAKITRDITDRRDAEIALRQAQAQRVHAQKMDALGQLTGSIVHDFNNLLTVVESFVRLGKKVGADPEMKRATESVELALQRGAALTRQLLAFSRKQAARAEVVSLAERVEAVRAMIAGSMRKSVKLVAAVGPETWPVKVDPGELELGLVNIAFNARDAMPDGGLVTITAENVLLSSGDNAAGLQGEFVALRVTDTGIGIAADVLPQVFEPFFTTKGPEKGTGLGLAQVYGLAQQSGGAVTIDSEIGKGTTVTIYLPRADMAVAAQSAEPEQPASANVVPLRTKGRFADDQD